MAYAFQGKVVPSPPVWFAIGQGQDTDLPLLVREQTLTSAYRDQPNDIALLNTLATLDDARDNDLTIRRIGWCRAALALQPRSITMWINLGSALGALRDYPGAEYAFRKAMQLAPDNAVAYNNLGNMYRNLRRYSEALPLFDRAVHLNSRYATAHTNRGGTLGELGRWEEAIPAHLRAIEIDPTYASADYNLGVAYQGLANQKLARVADAPGIRKMAFRAESLLAHQHAVAAYESSVTKDRTFATAYRNMGVSMRTLGNAKGAKAAYLKAMEHGDDGPEVRTNMAGVFADERDYLATIRWAREAIQRNPNFANAHAVLGSAHFLRREFAEARRAITEAARLDPARWGHLMKILPPIPVAPLPREVNQ